MKTRAFLLSTLLPLAAASGSAKEYAASSAAVTEVPASTAAAGPARVEPVLGGPIRFQLRYDDRRKTTAEVTYLLRWDMEDVKRLPRSAARLAMNPFGTAERAAREMFSDVDIGFYSMRFRLGKYLPLDHRHGVRP